MFTAIKAITDSLGYLAAGLSESFSRSDADSDSDSDSHSDSGSPSQDNADLSNRQHEPSVADVLRVRLLLSRMTIGKEGGEFSLPLELVNIILDFAEYWPHSTSEYIHDGVTVSAHGGDPWRENLLILRSRPLGFLHSKLPTGSLRASPHPVGMKEFGTEVFQNHIGRHDALANPCRKIVFTLVSHDQGWSQYPGGTYENSWTWFSVGIERFMDDGQSNNPGFGLGELRTIVPVTEEAGDDDNRHPPYVHPLLPTEDLLIQRNICSDRSPKEHRVVWSYLDNDDPQSPEVQQRLRSEGRGTATGDGKFVRELKLGDVVNLLAHARFPMWVNHVERVKIDIYWAV